MALLSFPTSPTNGQLYPTSPLSGQNQYEWAAAEQTWRLLGPATGVAAGTYGNASNIPNFTVDFQGRLTYAGNIDISGTYIKTNNIGAYNGYVWPNADGTANQVLITDGAGNLIWKTFGATDIILIPSINGNTTVQAALQDAIYDVSSTTNSIDVVETPVGQVALTLKTATPTRVGGVSVDNDTITVTAGGEISAHLRYVYYDDISGLFDGALKTFSLQVGGVPTPPTPITNIMVVLGGVPQVPASAYTISGSTITFNSAPEIGTSFMATTIA